MRARPHWARRRLLGAVGVASLAAVVMLSVSTSHHPLGVRSPDASIPQLVSAQPSDDAPDPSVTFALDRAEEAYQHEGAYQIFAALDLGQQARSRRQRRASRRRAV